MNSNEITLFSQMAIQAAAQSKDPVRKVGAVVVHRFRMRHAVGFNRLPGNVPNLPEILNNKVLKNYLMVHAEMAAILEAKFQLSKGYLFVTRYPCNTCAIHIAEKKIDKIYCAFPEFDHPVWGESQKAAALIFDYCKIQVNHLGPLTIERKK